MAGENNHFYGGQSEETLKQIGKKQKKNWEDPKHIYNSKEFRKKRSKAIAKSSMPKGVKKWWESSENKKKMKKARTYALHHKDADRKNNSPDNLIYMLGKVHSSLHNNAYHYLAETGQVEDYLKWFKRKFKVKYYKRKPKEET